MENINAFSIVEKHINEWDYWGLLATGAPPDEYEMEIKKIVNALPNVKSDMDLAHIIKGVFDKAFAHDHNLEWCSIVAKKIRSEFIEER